MRISITFQDRHLSKYTLLMFIAWLSILSRSVMSHIKMISPFKEGLRSTWKQSIPLYSICIGTKRLFAPTNPKTTIGTTVFMRTNPLIIDAARTSITISLRSAKTMIRILDQVAMISVSSHILHLRDFIIHTSIKLIRANNTQARKEIVRKVNYVLLFTKSLSTELFKDAISCSCMIDWSLQKPLKCRNGKKNFY